MSVLVFLIISCIAQIICKEQCQDVTPDFKNLTDFQSIKVSFVSQGKHIQFSNNHSLIVDVGFIMRHKTTKQMCFYKRDSKWSTYDSVEDTLFYHPVNFTKFAILDFIKGNRIIYPTVCENEMIEWDSQEILYTILYRYVTSFHNCEIDSKFSKKPMQMQDIYTDIKGKEMVHYLDFTVEVNEDPTDEEWENLESFANPVESCFTIGAEIEACEALRAKVLLKERESKRFHAYAFVLLATFIFLLRVLMYDILEKCKKY